MADTETDAGRPVSCARCGATSDPATPDTAPLGWSMDVGERGRQWRCGACTRDDVRSIEAKLPEQWW